MGEDVITATEQGHGSRRNESELTSARLVMLGTIHRDREGSALLWGWLDHFKPDVITLEFSRYGMMFRKAQGAELRSRLDALLKKMEFNTEQPLPGAVQALYDYIELPLEYTEASRYADRWGIPLYLLDVDLYSYMNLRNINELIDEKNLRTWLDGHTVQKDDVAKERTLARLFFDKGVRTFAYTEEMLTRDRHIREKLTLLARHYGGKRILHVCGWQHLVDRENMYRSLNPVKVFVYDRPLCI